MQAYAKELKMPTNYVDMSASELEYDGGFSWKQFEKVALITAVAVGLTCILAGAFVAPTFGAMAATEAAVVTNISNVLIANGVGIITVAGLTAGITEEVSKRT